MKPALRASFVALGAFCLLLPIAGCGQKESNAVSVAPAPQAPLTPQQQQVQNEHAQAAAADAQKSAAARPVAGH